MLTVSPAAHFFFVCAGICLSHFRKHHVSRWARRRTRDPVPFCSLIGALSCGRGASLHFVYMWNWVLYFERGAFTERKQSALTSTLICLLHFFTVRDSHLNSTSLLNLLLWQLGYHRIFITFMKLMSQSQAFSLNQRSRKEEDISNCMQSITCWLLSWW